VKELPPNKQMIGNVKQAAAFIDSGGKTMPKRTKKVEKAEAAEAKRAETKEKRVAQAVEWMAEGKQRNWKYQNC
jgi:hypothetical protein